MTHSSPTTELLSPAGDWDALRAAVANGADAVYFGLSNFNARHRATNFTIAELPEVIAYLHQRNVRGYVTCNTLIFSAELEEIARFVAAIAEAGADAVIVQDLGLARLIARMVPGLPVHGSTQMTLTEARGIEFVRRLGIERVILARELSLADIERVRTETELPVEVFVHGALCVAYSGQCLTSEALGGRSANRGQCAQACRLPYELIVDGHMRDLDDYAYLLSPQDLAGYDHIADLVRLGVTSLKIEGRLKSAQYVATTTRTYRQALDKAGQGEAFTLQPQQQLDLAQSFSRGFAPGFLEGPDHQRLVHGRFPKSRGVFVGKVTEIRSGNVVIELAAEHQALESHDLVIKPGDGVVFDEGHPEQDEQGGRVLQVRPFARAGAVELTFRAGAVNLAAVAVGSLVWKTDDPDFRHRIEQTYSRDSTPRRVPVAVRVSGCIGGKLSITMCVGSYQAIVEWMGPLQAARKHPLDEVTIREQLGRLGDTPFELADVEIEVREPIMVPKSVLNDLRRQGVAQLLHQREADFVRGAVHADALDAMRDEIAVRHVAGTCDPSPQMYVLVRTLQQLDAVCEWSQRQHDALAMVYCDFEDVRRYCDAVERAHGASLAVGVATLRIIKPGEEGLLAKIASTNADAVLVRNLAALGWFREHAPQTPLVGDYSLNVANELTADLFLGEGLSRLVPSYDLSWEQLAGMLSRITPAAFEVVIHQHIPMFHMEHCVFAATLSDGKDWRDCGRPCDHHRVELRDRVGAAFPLLADVGCRNTVFNSVPQSAAEYLPRMLKLGLRHFRVELLREDAAEVETILTRYARVLAGIDDGRSAWRGLQVLNQLGVTRGTLSD